MTRQKSGELSDARTEAGLLEARAERGRSARNAGADEANTTNRE